MKTRSILPYVFAALLPLAASSQTVTLLKDINPGTPSGVASDIRHKFIKVGATTYFEADDGVNGPELWKTNGTTAGTVMVKDIHPGNYGSMFLNPQNKFVAIGSTVYFPAYADHAVGYQLWKTDGTAAGTVLVADPNPGSGSLATDIHHLTAVGSTLFFYSDNGINGTELWKSDGTAGGTVMVKDINPGSGSCISGSVAPPVAMGGVLYFVANDGSTGNELWRSDGTAAGTYKVIDLSTFFFGSIPTGLTIFNGRLYFTAYDATFQYRVYSSDGSTAGTAPILDNSGNPVLMNTSEYVVAGSKLYFTGYTNAAGTELWVTDGTPAGTFMTLDASPGNSGAMQLDYGATRGDTIYYREYTTAGGMELWKSAGTAASTVSITEALNPGTTSTNTVGIWNINSTLYLNLERPATGYELYKTDGTAAGTVLVQDIQPGTTGSNPVLAMEVNGALLVAGNTSTFGLEFFAGNAPVPLAQELTHFDAALSGEDVLVSWQAAAATGSRFVVERSVDGRGFGNVGVVEPVSASSLEYHFADKAATELGSAVLYYRLRTESASGELSYSSVAAVRMPLPSSSEWVLYPNPATQQATLLLPAATQGNVRVVVKDAMGRTVLEAAHATGDARRILVSVAKLPAGSYWLEAMMDGGLRFVTRLQKL